MPTRPSEPSPEDAINPDVDVVDLIEESVAVFGLDLRIKAWNAEAERLYGWTRGEVIGGVIQAFIKCSPSEPLTKILNDVHETGTWRGEFLRRTKNGGEIAVRAKWSLRRDAHGAMLDIVESSRDITELKVTERRYQNFFHFLPVPLLRLEGQRVVDIFTRFKKQGVVDFSQYLKDHPDVLIDILEGLQIEEVNQRAVEILRGRSVEEFTGSVRRYWTHSLDAFREVAAARYAGKSGFEALVKIVAHDGTVLDVLFFAAFGSITGAENVSLVGLIDVTDRIKAQEMLARVQAEMAHAARVSVLGELTASIAHEVSQPLTAISTNTEASLLWLGHSPPNIEEIRDLSVRTSAEVQRAADIIHRIRSMAVRATPEYNPIDVNTVVTEAMLFLRHELQRNEVATSLQLGKSLPEIFGDSVQLQQVIVNLAVNAMQAMAQDDGRARELSVTTAIGVDGNVTVSVKDNGPGIAADAFARLFESFFTTKSTGMGMGLPICRSIIEAHGGTIAAANRRDGPGACFSIILPLHPHV